MTPRYLLPTLAAALLLSATTGCQDTSEADGFDLEEPADTGSPDTGLSDADTADTPSPTFPDTTGTPCWPTEQANPQNTGRSPCEGPVEPEESRMVFSTTLSRQPRGALLTRVGPDGMLVVARDMTTEDAPVFNVFDTTSNTRTSWRLAANDVDVELQDFGLTSGHRIVTLEYHDDTSDGSSAVVRSFTPTGSERWSRRLPVPEGLDPSPSLIEVFPETQAHGIRATAHTGTVQTSTDRTFVYRLDDDGTLRNTTSERHLQPPDGQGFGPRHRAALVSEPTDTDEQARPKALLSGPDGPREVPLRELGLDIGSGRPSARPLFAPNSNDALFLVSTFTHRDFDWVCDVPYTAPTEGSCVQIRSSDSPLSFTDPTLLIDDTLVDLTGHDRAPGLGTIDLDDLSSAADDYRTLVDDDYEAMNWVADARGVVYARIRPDQSDAHQELLAARPDGTRLWQRDVGLPDAHPHSLVVGDGHLYAAYLRTRETPYRLEVYQVGQ